MKFQSVPLLISFEKRDFPSSCMTSDGQAARSLYHESTIQSADSLESHPSIGGLFALGTYQVDQRKEQVSDATVAGKKEEENDDDDDENKHETTCNSPEYSRKGTLRLKKIDRLSDGEFSSDTLTEFETTAVLDMKWLQPASSLLSIALADSQISLYTLENLTLKHLKNIQVNTTQALCLSLDWSDRIGGFPGGYGALDDRSNEAKAIVSQSDGTLACISHTLTSSPIIETWKAHEYEAWTTAFDCWSQGNVLWSGGDDLCLKGWDLRKICKDGERLSIFTVKKCFEGGVTSMQSHHLRQHLWAVGSYDGQLRLFDSRQTTRPLSTTPVGGGIWRIKWHPTKAEQLLLGCMHDGFKVMQLDSLLQSIPQELPREEMQIHTRFDEHDSLAYGCDWNRDKYATQDYIYSCSFYDAVWHAWQCN